MEQKDINEYKRQLKEVERLLHQSEKFLKEKGLNTPVENIELEKKEKIAFPSGQIRTKFYFEKNYRFAAYLSSKTLISNICYSLQCLDVFSYFINRIHISLSAGKIFLKQGMINIFAIIESILFGAADELHKFCVKDDIVCKKAAKCPYYIKSAEKYSFGTLIEKYQELKVIKLTEKGKGVLLTAKKNRDYIHTYLMPENELQYEDYSIDSYNTEVKFLLYLKANFADQIQLVKNTRRIKCTRFKKIQ